MKFDLAATFTSLLLLASTYSVSASPENIPADTPVSDILTLAQNAFSSGHSQDALTYYSIAITRDPSNYLTLYKRGVIQLSLGRVAQAHLDFNRVLELKPTFEGALTQRAKLRARTGDFKGAKGDYRAAGRQDGSEEMSTLVEAEGAEILAHEAAVQGRWEDCVSQSGIALMTASGSAELRQLRAKCRLDKPNGGELEEALSDLQHAAQLSHGASQSLALQISAMAFYSLGDQQKGLDAVKKCLHSDPDSKQCSKLHKREKMLSRQLKKIKELIDKRSFSKAMSLLTAPDAEGEPSLLDDIKADTSAFRREGYIYANTPAGLYTSLLSTACDSFLEMNSAKRGAPYCTELLTHDSKSLPGLLHKGQTQLDAEEYEDAVRTLTAAKDAHGGSHPRLGKLLNDAHTRLRQSKKKDYYKVLGVGRDAAPKEIKRAYLRLSKIHHPDKAPSEAERPAREDKMAQINEAYEVLSDPELKARFDSGDDPNDPERGGPGGPGGPVFFQSGPGGGQQFFFQSGGGGGMPNFGGMPKFNGFPFGGGGGGGGQQRGGAGGPGGGFRFQFP